MFNKDFYPTPEKLISKMCSGLDFSYKRVLEPSAGKGNIIDYINKKRNIECKIDAIEIEPELQSILYDKDCSVVGDDFLSFKTMIEYDLIIMNPPFSEGAKHLLKAIEMSEQNVTKKTDIVCLVNKNTIDNDFSNERKVLLKKLEQYNADIENIEGAFVNSERKTNVSVSLIKLSIEPTTKDFIDIDFDNYDKVSFNSNELSINVMSKDIQKRKNEIEVLVELYQRHSKQLKKSYQEALKLNSYDNHLYNITKSEENFGDKTYVILDVKDINEEVEKLRYTYWNLILNTDKFNKKLTQSGKEKLSKTIIESSNLEITYENVNRLLGSLYQNIDTILKMDAMDLFEGFTKGGINSYNGNVHYYNGWKTNDGFKVNKKVIIRTDDFRGENELYHYYHDHWVEWSEVPEYTKIKNLVKDIKKVMSNFTDKEIPIEFTRDKNLYENDFLKLQTFKKGTTHITFKDQETLDRFNIFCGIESGMLPTYEEARSDIRAVDIYKEEFGKNVMELLGGLDVDIKKS